MRFRHALIRDVAYGGIPKSVRADIHESFAAWLQIERPRGIRRPRRDRRLPPRAGAPLPHRARAQATQRTSSLAARAARLLGEAGRQAFARDDMPAAADLLGRTAASPRRKHAAAGGPSRPGTCAVGGRPRRRGERVARASLDRGRCGRRRADGSLRRARAGRARPAHGRGRRSRRGGRQTRHRPQLGVRRRRHALAWRGADFRQHNDGRRVRGRRARFPACTRPCARGRKPTRGGACRRRACATACSTARRRSRRRCRPARSC